MEQNLAMAIEQFKQKEEAGLNYIYSKTYNYMYLRAKTLLKRENDIQGLMKEVYTALVEASEEITRENLYEWLGKKVYVLGCQKYRKKKAREAVVVEMDRADMEVKKGIDSKSRPHCNQILLQLLSLTSDHDKMHKMSPDTDLAVPPKFLPLHVHFLPHRCLFSLLLLRPAISHA